MTEIYSKNKHPFYPIRIDQSPATPDAEIIGWVIHHKPKGMLTTPRPENLSFQGWIQVFCCVLIAWPCSCIPCCFSCNYETFQCPIFEDSISTHRSKSF